MALFELTLFSVDNPKLIEDAQHRECWTLGAGRDTRQGLYVDFFSLPQLAVFSR